ncbi:hypothetical protein LTR36_000573 [Oleoguttula mirabilis]|uniref:Nuclear matrix protein n=1 Tax=Oleoguttula mirabilis TaxID=1507867 RepID=A0AAV9JPS8_9PEZI|nr:hypothetical protein LTR36_000573 [Oleoguttula mirabilis]
MAAASAAELQPVAQVTARLQALLDRARTVKPESAIEPPLSVSEIIQDVDALHSDVDERRDQTYRFNITETAARRIFYGLINSTDIEDPAFIQVWDLLDVVLLCGDRGSATPELSCYLIEELLDSQTTAGCRIVFDYLESRRERLVAKDFHKKNLIFLRSCNELLRRLSRAEDAIFCGRVFFFLFQTFPLGDKSAVNLRGEFHVDNTTKFEVPVNADGEQMEVDDEPFKGVNAIQTLKAETPQPPTKPGAKATPAKVVKKTPEEVVLSNSELYPIFWRLQQDFSDPTRLFARDHFATFQKGLAVTLTKFKKTPTVVSTKSTDDNKRGAKRKLGDSTDEQATDHFVDNYNPKYLTSRDLFDLELSDLAFQRHIMVQALILIDFLLSLTEKARTKLAALEATNKSMLYSFTLNADDAKWAVDVRATITKYLEQTPTRETGRFYHRMVDTILARDKNWVRWKVESCPSIVRDPVPTEQELEARKGARDSARIRRIPERPPGAIDLSFLDEGKGGGLEALKNPTRYTAPSAEELIEGVRTDKLDLDMAMDDAEKAGLDDAISNKTWRALRQVRASNLSLLDKVDPTKDVEEVFNPPLAGTTPEPVDINGGIVDPAPVVTITDGDNAETGDEAHQAESVDIDAPAGVAVAS